MTQLVSFWWMLGAGVLLFMMPMFAIGHLILTARDHRRHHAWKVTGLALAWPILCVAMIGVLGGNMSPPLFGIPLAIVFTMSWLMPKRHFMFGVGSFFSLCILIVVSFALSDEGKGQVQWGYLLFWPLALAALLTWRIERLAALEVLEPVD